LRPQREELNMRILNHAQHRVHRAHGATYLFLFSVVSVISVLIAGNAAADGEASQKSVRRAATRAYHGSQARNRAEQTDRVSRKIKLARNGSVSVGNLSGDIVVSGG